MRDRLPKSLLGLVAAIVVPIGLWLAPLPTIAPASADSHNLTAGDEDAPVRRRGMRVRKGAIGGLESVGGGAAGGGSEDGPTRKRQDDRKTQAGQGGGGKTDQGGKGTGGTQSDGKDGKGDAASGTAAKEKTEEDDKVKVRASLSYSEEAEPGADGKPGQPGRTNRRKQSDDCATISLTHGVQCVATRIRKSGGGTSTTGAGTGGTAGADGDDGEATATLDVDITPVLTTPDNEQTFILTLEIGSPVYTVPQDMDPKSRRQVTGDVAIVMARLRQFSLAMDEEQSRKLRERRTLTLNLRSPFRGLRKLKLAGPVKLPVSYVAGVELRIVDLDGNALGGVVHNQPFRVEAKFVNEAQDDAIVTLKWDEKGSAEIDMWPAFDEDGKIEDKLLRSSVYYLRSRQFTDYEPAEGLFNEKEYYEEVMLDGARTNWKEGTKRSEAATAKLFKGKWQVTHVDEGGKNQFLGSAVVADSGKSAFLVLTGKKGFKRYTSVEIRALESEKPGSSQLEIRFERVQGKTTPYGRSAGIEPHLKAKFIDLPTLTEKVEFSLNRAKLEAKVILQPAPDERFRVLLTQRSKDRLAGHWRGEDMKGSGQQTWARGAKVARILVLDNQMSRKSSARAHYPFGRNKNKGSQSRRTLFVYGTGLPAGYGDAIVVESGEAGITYQSRLLDQDRALAARGWALAKKVDPGFTKPEDYSALVLIASFDRSVLPGAKVFSLNGAVGGWPLAFADATARLYFTQVPPRQGTPTDASYTSAVVHVEARLETELPFKQGFEVELYHDGEKQPEKIRLTKVTDPGATKVGRRSLKGRLYRSTPIHLYRSDQRMRAPPNARGAIRIDFGKKVQPPRGGNEAKDMASKPNWNALKSGALGLLSATWDKPQVLRIARPASLSVYDKPADLGGTVWLEALNKARACYENGEKLGARSTAGEMTNFVITEVFSVKNLKRGARMLSAPRDTTGKVLSNAAPGISILREAGTRRNTITLGAHAAALLIRDEFIKASQAKSLSYSTNLRFGRSLDRFIERAQKEGPRSDPLWQTATVEIKGDEVPLKSLLNLDEVKKKHSTMGYSGPMGLLREKTRQALQAQIKAIAASIETTKKKGDCDLEHLMVVSARPAPKLVAAIIPRLVKLEDDGKTQWWAPDGQARNLVSNLNNLGEAVRALDAYASLDKAVAAMTLAAATGVGALALSQVGAMSTAAYLTLAADALDVAVFGTLGVAEYVDKQGDVDWAKGASSTLGADVYDQAKAGDPSGFWTAAGVLLPGLGVLGSIGDLKALGNIERGADVARTLTKFDHAELAKLSDADSRALLAYLSEMKNLRALAGKTGIEGAAERLLQLNRRALTDADKKFLAKYDEFIKAKEAQIDRGYHIGRKFKDMDPSAVSKLSDAQRADLAAYITDIRTRQAALKDPAVAEAGLNGRIQLTAAWEGKLADKLSDALDANPVPYKVADAGPAAKGPKPKPTHGDGGGGGGGKGGKPADSGSGGKGGKSSDGSGGGKGGKPADGGGKGGKPGDQGGKGGKPADDAKGGGKGKTKTPDDGKGKASSGKDGEPNGKQPSRDTGQGGQGGQSGQGGKGRDTGSSSGGRQPSRDTGQPDGGRQPSRDTGTGNRGDQPGRDTGPTNRGDQPGRDTGPANRGDPIPDGGRRVADNANDAGRGGDGAGTPATRIDDGAGTPVTRVDDGAGTPATRIDDGPGTPAKRIDDGPGTPATRIDDGPDTLPPPGRIDDGDGNRLANAGDEAGSAGSTAGRTGDSPGLKPAEPETVPGPPLKDGELRLRDMATGEAAESVILGKQVGKGSYNEVHKVAGKPNRVARVSKSKAGGLGERLDEFGRDAILDINSPAVRVPKRDGIYVIAEGPKAGRRVEVVENIPWRAKEQLAANPGGLPTPGQAIALDEAKRAFWNKGYAWLDNHRGNYGFEPLPGTDRWRVVVFDTGGIVKAVDDGPGAAANARTLQRALDNPGGDYAAKLRNAMRRGEDGRVNGISSSVREDVLVRHGDLIDRNAMKIENAADVGFRGDGMAGFPKVAELSRINNPTALKRARELLRDDPLAASGLPFTRLKKAKQAALERGMKAFDDMDPEDARSFKFAADRVSKKLKDLGPSSLTKAEREFADLADRLGSGAVRADADWARAPPGKLPDRTPLATRGRDALLDSTLNDLTRRAEAAELRKSLAALSKDTKVKAGAQALADSAGDLAFRKKLLTRIKKASKELPYNEREVVKSESYLQSLRSELKGLDPSDAKGRKALEGRIAKEEKHLAKLNAEVDSAKKALKGLTERDLEWLSGQRRWLTAEEQAEALQILKRNKSRWPKMLKDKDLSLAQQHQVIAYRKAVVDDMLDEIKTAVEARTGQKIDRLAFGSNNLTSDYDLSIKVTGGRGGAAEVVREFNRQFRKRFGAEPGLVFDTNVYTEPAYSFFKAPKSGRPKKLSPVQEDAVRQTLYKETATRRYLDDDQWQAHKSSLLAGATDDEARALRYAFDQVEGNFDAVVRGIDKKMADLAGGRGELNRLQKAFDDAKAAGDAKTATKLGDQLEQLKLRAANERYAEILESVDGFMDEFHRLQNADLAALGKGGLLDGANPKLAKLGKDGTGSPSAYGKALTQIEDLAKEAADIRRAGGDPSEALAKAEALRSQWLDRMSGQIRNRQGQALYFASEAYQTDGAIAHVVGELQAGGRKISVDSLNAPPVKSKLTPGEYLDSLAENRANMFKEMTGARDPGTGEFKDANKAAAKAAKYFIRQLDAAHQGGLKLADLPDQRVIEATVAVDAVRGDLDKVAQALADLGLDAKSFAKMTEEASNNLNVQAFQKGALRRNAKQIADYARDVDGDLAGLEAKAYRNTAEGIAKKLTASGPDSLTDTERAFVAGSNRQAADLVRADADWRLARPPKDLPPRTPLLGPVARDQAIADALADLTKRADQADLGKSLAAISDDPAVAYRAGAMADSASDLAFRRKLLNRIADAATDQRELPDKIAEARRSAQSLEKDIAKLDPEAPVRQKLAQRLDDTNQQVRKWEGDLEAAEKSLKGLSQRDLDWLSGSRKSLTQAERDEVLDILKRNKSRWPKMLKDDSLSIAERHQVLTFRKDVVDGMLDEIKAAVEAKTGRKIDRLAFGSNNLTSDYDLSIKVAGGRGGAAEVVREFNRQFRKRFGAEPGIVFDTNVYTEPAYSFFKAPRSGNAKQLSPVQEDVVRQTLYKETANRRYMTDDQWRAHKTALLADATEAEAQALRYAFERVEGNFDAVVRGVDTKMADLAGGRGELNRLRDALETAEKAGDAKAVDAISAQLKQLELRAANERYADILESVDDFMDEFHRLKGADLGTWGAEDIAISGKAVDDLRALSNRITKARASGAPVDDLMADAEKLRGKLLDQMARQIRNRQGQALYFASEAYQTDGAIAHVVGELQAGGRKITAESLTAPPVASKLTPDEYFDSFSENRANMFKELTGVRDKATGKFKDPRKAAAKAAKYFIRQLDAAHQGGLDLARLNDPRIIEATVAVDAVRGDLDQVARALKEMGLDADRFAAMAEDASNALNVQAFKKGALRRNARGIADYAGESRREVEELMKSLEQGSVVQ